MKIWMRIIHCLVSLRPVRKGLNPTQNLFLGRESLPIPTVRFPMSKKYVPSFLKQGELPTTPASFDAFSGHKKQKDHVAAFDAFPMNKRGVAVTRNEHEFDAFSKVKKLPEMEAFSAFHSTRKFGGVEEGGSDAFSAFGSTTRGTNGTEEGHDFPMSKRMGENRPPKGDAARGARNPHLVFEPMTYGGALLAAPMTPAKKPAVVVVVRGKGVEEAKTVDAVDDPNGLGQANRTRLDDSSFAAKFATKMKIIDDPSYVPPPTVVDMESEQDFPTLGVAPTKARGQSQGWTQPLRSEEWTHSIQAVVVDTEPIKKTKKVAKKGAVKGDLDKKMIPVVPQRIAKKRLEQQEESKDGDFKPIEYEEDAFEEDAALDASDLDEEALFADDDGDEEEDELDPTVYENRRPDDSY